MLQGIKLGFEDLFFTPNWTIPPENDGVMIFSPGLGGGRLFLFVVFWFTAISVYCLMLPETPEMVTHVLHKHGWAVLIPLLGVCLMGWVPWCVAYLLFTLRLDVQQGRYCLTRGAFPLRWNFQGPFSDLEHVYTEVIQSYSKATGQPAPYYRVVLAWRRRGWLSGFHQVILVSSYEREWNMAVAEQVAARLNIPDRGLLDTPQVIAMLKSQKKKLSDEGPQGIKE